MKTLLIILLALFSTNPVAQTNTIVDTDGNGLIEINDLEMLDAIRFQLDGTGYRESKTAPEVAAGCPNNVCRGYELTRDLDFNDDDSYSSTANRIVWTTGAGWQPIGYYRSSRNSNPFLAIFEGNGFTISNLKIDISVPIDVSGAGRVGLFGYTHSDSEIANVGLVNVDIAAPRSVGSLVGWNEGTITNSYATGSVRGRSSVGGLAGSNEGTIMNSYVTGSVRGRSSVGGLAGSNSGIIMNSYATGSVLGEYRVGGLVSGNSGTIMSSYATGSVLGHDEVGGLGGGNPSTFSRGIIRNSYWDKWTSGQTSSSGGEGKTTIELQEPTTATGIYSSWSTDEWDFGTSSQYPVLKYTDNPNTDSSECRSAGNATTDLPVCRSLLSPTLRYGLSELQLVEGDLSPDFDMISPSYRGTVVSSTSMIQFRPITVNPDTKIYIKTNEEARHTAIDSGGKSSIISLNTDGITTIEIKVENDGKTTQTIVYTLHLNYYEFNGDIDRDNNGLIEIDDLEGLDAMRYQLDGTGYRKSETAPKIVAGCPNNGCRGYELTKNLDDDSYSSTAKRVIRIMKAGWQPIGVSSVNSFTGKFEGNGFTISNLTINRSDTNLIGLFGYAGSGAEIANVGLLNLDGLVGRNEGIIKNCYAINSVAKSSLSGVGGLVGANYGTITNSYAAGFVGSGGFVGGLVGWNEGTIMNSYATGSVGSVWFVGGLVGTNNGTITNSYATGSVTQSGHVGSTGGLVGENRGTITNSYATGSVEGRSSGGLVGRNEGIVTNSYATGSVSGGTGGLVGGNYNGGTITNSYWDINTSGIKTGFGRRGSIGKTTVELQSPITAINIYIRWSTGDWDFGTSSQYPILKYADSDILLPGQGVGLRDLEILTSGAGLSPVFGTSTTHYVINFVAETSDISLQLRAYSMDATIKVVKQGEERDYFENKGSEGQSEPIPIDRSTTLTIIVSEANTTVTTIYTISSQELEMPDIAEISRIIVSENGVMDTDDTVNEGSRITLGAGINGGGNYRYKWTQTQGEPLMISGLHTASPSFMIPTDYIESDTSPSTDVVVQLTLEYGRFNLLSILSKTITIIEANTTPTIMITPSTRQTLPLNSTAHIVISVVDDNFNLDDVVMLEAMSSSQTIVSVTPARVANITTDTITTFLLSAKQDGEATITFTAIDSGGLRDSETVSADVITTIRVRVKVFIEGSLQ